MGVSLQLFFRKGLDNRESGAQSCSVATATEEENEMYDPRYSIAREWCGYAKPRWVLRFCGEFIGSFTVKNEARAAASAYEAKRWA